MSEEHVSHPYYKVFAWLTALTIAEIAWGVYVQEPRFLLISGLAILAAIKAAMVGLYYMHLKYEGKLIWAVIIFPVILVGVMIAGLLPDAIGYY